MKNIAIPSHEIPLGILSAFLEKGVVVHNHELGPNRIKTWSVSS